MGRVLQIENAETAALATELSAMTGEPVDEAVAHALRMRMADALRERQAQEKARTSLAAFHDLLENPRPGSDHGWMYDDETGLPIW